MHVCDEAFSHVPEFRPDWRSDSVVSKASGELILSCIFDPRNAICELWVNHNINLTTFKSHFIEILCTCDIARATHLPPRYEQNPIRAMKNISYSKFGAFPWSMIFRQMPASGMRAIVGRYSNHLTGADSDMD